MNPKRLSERESVLADRNGCLRGVEWLNSWPRNCMTAAGSGAGLGLRRGFSVGPQFLTVGGVRMQVRSKRLPPLVIALLAILLFAGLIFLPQVRENPRLTA